MNKKVEKTLSVEIKADEAETSPDASTENQARAYIMSLLKDTKAETTSSKPILKKVTLKIILGKIKTSPKLHAPSVPFYVFPGTPSRQREVATKTENKAWDPNGSTISQLNSHLHLIISTVDISELNNAEYSDNDANSETQGLESRTEIDSHANMPVFGQNCYILSDSGNF